MKITLTEFDAFQKQLPEGIYFDGDDNFVKDEFYDGKYDPTEIVDINEDDIAVLWEGKGDCPLKSDDFITEFKKWKTPLKYELISVKIPKGKKKELFEMIKEKWGEVK